MRKSVILCALLVAMLAMGASATVSSAQNDGDPGSPTQTFDFNAGEYYFAPDMLSVQPGPITINLTNVGPERPHAFNVRDADGNDVFTSDRIQPGESSNLEFTLDEGTYQFYCPVTGHADRGEVGTLIVSAA